MTHKIIINPQEDIACPHCEKQYALRDALTHQLIERYESEYDSMVANERSELVVSLTKEIERKQTKAFDQQLHELQVQLEDSQQEVKTTKGQTAVIKKKVLAQAKQDAMEETQFLKDEVAAKDVRIAAFRKAELSLRKEKAAVEEQQAELTLELERKLEVERKNIEAKINESFSMREAELKKKISDAQKSNEELTRKLEQGSQQLQGEVLELHVEQLLEQAYPFDGIAPVKKGARGADVIQSVCLRSGTICGTIVWETKRAENWSNKWIAKLKEDQQLVGGDIAVLVTTAMPAGVTESMMLQDGVWLVKPEMVKGISEALRTVLIESQRFKSISAGKSEQMESLFDYICSNQFAQRIRAVVEGYEDMRSDLEKEKTALQRIWKKREGQINKISNQVVSVCGELQGISASSLPHLDSLAELDLIAEA